MHFEEHYFVSAKDNTTYTLYIYYMERTKIYHVKLQIMTTSIQKKTHSIIENLEDRIHKQITLILLTTCILNIVLSH